MSYFRRRSGRGRKMYMRSGRSGTKLVQSKKTVSVGKIMSEIRKLKSKQKVSVVKAAYGQQSGTDMGDPYNGTILSNFVNWDLLWPSTVTSTHQSRPKMKWLSTIVDCNITLDNINNEEGEIQFTAFLISPKNSRGQVALSGTVPTLVADQDYYTYAGKTYLNLNAFKIHAMKRFTLTGGDGADMQADKIVKRFRLKAYHKGRVVENTDGSWKSLSRPGEPSDDLFLVCFNNNSVADLENPRWDWNVLHNVETQRSNFFMRFWENSRLSCNVSMQDTYTTLDKIILAHRSAHARTGIRKT